MDSIPNEIISHIVSWLPGYLSFGTLFGTELYDYHKRSDSHCRMFALINGMETRDIPEIYSAKELAKYRAYMVIFDDDLECKINEKIDDDLDVHLYQYRKERIYSSDIMELPHHNFKSEMQCMQACLYDYRLIETHMKMFASNLDVLFEFFLHIIPSGRINDIHENDKMFYLKETKIHFDDIEITIDKSLVNTFNRDPRYSWLGLRALDNGQVTTVEISIPVYYRGGKRTEKIPTIFRRYRLNEAEMKFVMTNPYYTYRYLLHNYYKNTEEDRSMLIHVIRDHPKYMYDIARLYIFGGVPSVISTDMDLVVKDTHIHGDRNGVPTDISPRHAYKILLNDMIEGLGYLGKNSVRVCLDSLVTSKKYTLKLLEKMTIHRDHCSTNTKNYRQEILDTIVSWEDPPYTLLLVNRALVNIDEKVISALERSRVCWEIFSKKYNYIY